MVVLVLLLVRIQWSVENEDEIESERQFSQVDTVEKKGGGATK